MFVVVAPYSNRGVGKDKVWKSAEVRKTTTIWRVSIIGNAAVLKTADTERYSGFESLALRQKMNTVDVNIGGEKQEKYSKGFPLLWVKCR